MTRWVRMLLLMTLVATIPACSSAGFSTKQTLTAPRTIKAPTYIPPGMVPYVPRFTALLEAKGFVVGKTDDPQALELRFEHNDSVMNLSVSASLWRQGVPVLSASATNSGWGTAIARGSALNSLVDKTAKQFEEQLTDISGRTQIVPDRIQ